MALSLPRFHLPARAAGQGGWAAPGADPAHPGLDGGVSHVTHSTNEVAPAVDPSVSQSSVNRLSDIQVLRLAGYFSILCANVNSLEANLDVVDAIPADVRMYQEARCNVDQIRRLTASSRTEGRAAVWGVTVPDGHANVKPTCLTATFAQNMGMRPGPHATSPMVHATSRVIASVIFPIGQVPILHINVYGYPGGSDGAEGKNEQLFARVMRLKGEWGQPAYDLHWGLQHDGGKVSHTGPDGVVGRFR